ncbi:DUF2500 domain-containing protein [Salisediminibacterium halotolerans]|uniref:DUF2500 domain-containing protein n=1 Tax=Salisediminibacterium halotolerans TaxID=517425 RepID=UPI0015A56506|nr:DUF2500 domain-containing protein [Salisediminibacterium haloalkalitolerans]
MLPIVAVIILAVSSVSAVRWLIEWSKNNKQPVETANAKLMSKREDTRRTGRSPGTRKSGLSLGRSQQKTSYFLTFEFEDGERSEFNVNGREYGAHAEGDVGELTYQGTRFHSFERITTV